MMKERIGVFGGTFNPIHLGHLKAAELVQKKFLLTKVLFVPSYIPPHKESAEIASPWHRLKMVELALSNHPQFISSPIEIEARGKSYSIRTLKKIKRLYPEAPIFFVLGIDAFLEIETWKDYQEVLKQCFFVVISRPGYRLQDAKKVLRGKYRSKMYEISEPDNIKDEIFLSFKIFLFPISSLDLASTDIRERVKKGDSIRGMVLDTVESYILQNRLYRDRNG